MIGHVTDPSVSHRLNRRELPEPSPGSHDAVLDVHAYAINRGERMSSVGAPTGNEPRRRARTSSRSLSTS